MKEPTHREFALVPEEELVNDAVPDAVVRKRRRGHGRARTTLQLLPRCAHAAALPLEGAELKSDPAVVIRHPRRRRGGLSAAAARHDYVERIGYSES